MIESLSLSHFTNWEQFSWNKSANMQIFSGPNGAGKTNLLHAIAILLHGKDVYKDCERLTQIGHESLLVQWMINWYKSKITYEQEKKLFHRFINNKSITPSKYFQTNNHRAVLFGANEMNTLYLSPSLRRNFLDTVLLLSHADFAKCKSDYTKILRQRNKLLGQIADGKANTNDLQYWNEQFTQLASKYTQYRLELFDFLQKNTKKVHDLLHTDYDLHITYDTKVNTQNIQHSIAEYLEKNKQRDILTKKTFIGPHLDDFIITIQTPEDAYSSTGYLSRGENKMLLFGLKLLTIEYLKQFFSGEVVLLLDDIFSELDESHIEKLLQIASPYQTFITTQPNHIPKSIVDIPVQDI